MNAVMKQLVLKDLYLNRTLIVLMVSLGLVSLVASGTSRMGFNIGGIVYMTTIVACGAVLVMHGVVNEHKEKSLLFVLSLPITPAQYGRAKLFSMLGAFLVVWIVLTSSVVGMIFLSPVPNGLIPLFATVSGLMLMNFCIVLSTALVTRYEPAFTAAIILTNASVSLLFVMLGAIPGMYDTMAHDPIIWNPVVLTVLAAEFAIATLAVSLPLILPGKTLT